MYNDLKISNKLTDAGNKTENWQIDKREGNMEETTITISHYK